MIEPWLYEAVISTPLRRLLSCSRRESSGRLVLVREGTLSKLPRALSKPWAARRGTPSLQHAYVALHTSNTTSAYLKPLAAYFKPLAAYHRPYNCIQ